MVNVKLVDSIVSGVNFFLIIFGTVGNLLTFLILIRKNLRTNYSYIRYLIALCILDIASLYTWNFSQVYQDLFSSNRAKIEFLGAEICRVFAFISYYFLQTSSWLLCAIGMDRIYTLFSSTSRKTTFEDERGCNLINTCKSFFAIIFKTLHNTSITTAIIMITLFFFNLVVLINNAEPYFEPFQNSTNYTSRSKRTYTCYGPEDFYKIWDIVHVIMYSLLPFFIIMIENAIIIWVTMAQANRMKKYKTNNNNNQSQVQISSVSVANLQVTTLNVNERSNTQFEQNNKEQRSQSRPTSASQSASKGAHVTNTLIFLTISFFFTTLPYSMFYATDLNEILVTSDTGNLIKRCISSLQYIRHAANFLIYVFTSTIIQTEIRKALTELRNLFKF